MTTRRSFGCITRVKRQGKVTAIKASYPTPVEAFSQWDGLPMRQCKSFPPTQEGYMFAENWLQDAFRAINYHEWTPPQAHRRTAARPMLFRDYATRWLEERRTSNGSPLEATTKDKYREYQDNHLNGFFGGRSMRSITPADVQRWWDTFPISATGEGQVARKRAYAHLKAIFATAVRDEVIDKSPCRIVATNPQTRHEYVIATPEQIRRAAELMPERSRLAVILAGYCGLRAGEIQALRRRDIDLKSGIIRVEHSAKRVKTSEGSETVIGNPKSRSSCRKVPMIPEVAQAVERHMDYFMVRKANDFLFPSPHDPRHVISGQTLRNQWMQARRQVPGLERMHFHDLRHTAATHLSEAGASVGLLKEFLGHTSIATANIYQQASATHRKQVFEQYGKQTETDGRKG